MENQHRKIKGYRELNQTEIDSMNKVKEMGIQLGELVEVLKTTTMSRNGDDSDKTLDNTVLAHDQRWVNIGATDLQKGLMALTRAIAKPEFF